MTRPAKERPPPAARRHGLARALAPNAWRRDRRRKEFGLVGAGVPCCPRPTTVIFTLILSHPLEFKISPVGIKIAVEKQTHLVVSGIDRQQVGQVAAECVLCEPGEPRSIGGRACRRVGEVLLECRLGRRPRPAPGEEPRGTPSVARNAIRERLTWGRCAVKTKPEVREPRPGPRRGLTRPGGPAAPWPCPAVPEPVPLQVIEQRGWAQRSARLLRSTGGSARRRSAAMGVEAAKAVRSSWVGSRTKDKGVEASWSSTAAASSITAASRPLAERRPSAAWGRAW